MVESQPSKLLVAGSIPVSRSTTSDTGNGVIRSCRSLIADWTAINDQMTAMTEIRD